jgi:hypothetical protein
MNITVGKDYRETKIGVVTVTWRRLPSKEEVVDILVHGPKLSEIRKTWEFKNTSTNNSAISFGTTWYDYVTREVQQHIYSNAGAIPQNLFDMNTKHVEEVIGSVFAHVGS